MSKILLIANLNCDHILQLSAPLSSGARLHYDDHGYRLGGGGANTGLGLVWAGHHVELLSQVGDDSLGDWLLSEAQKLGLGCRYVQRFNGATQALQLLMEPNGERTILRPLQPAPQLANAFEKALEKALYNARDTGSDNALHTAQHGAQTAIDALYINSAAQDLAEPIQRALGPLADDMLADGLLAKSVLADGLLANCLIVAQLGKSLSPQPCHYLLASMDDIQSDGITPSFAWAQRIAGASLKALIVTRGAGGATAYLAREQLEQPAVAAEVVDSTGAGDCYAAGLIHGLLSNMPLAEAMAEASRWAALALGSASSIPPVSLKHYLQAH